jgi:hypothetical protein
MTRMTWWREETVGRQIRGRGDRLLQAAVLLALAGVAPGAMASEDERPEEYQEIRAQQVFDGVAGREVRPFAFVVDPSTPGRGALNLAWTAGLGSGIAADRPIPVVLQGAGPSNQLSLGYGVTSSLEALADVTAFSSNGGTVASATLGMKLQLTSPDSPWRAAVMTGVLREGASGAAGVWGRAAGSWGAGPLLVEVNGYVEHVFAAGRDSVDYAVMGGASWRLSDGLRAGAEYVGQDLEELGARGAESGARQAVGPTVAVSLDRGRYQVVAATLFGLGAQSPTALVRVGLLGSF